MTAALRAILAATESLSPQEKAELINHLSTSLLHSDKASGDGSSGASFWHQATLEEVATEQTAQPIRHIDDLTADWWPPDETADQINAFTDRQRHEDRDLG